MIVLVNTTYRVKEYFFRPDIFREQSQKDTELKKKCIEKWNERVSNYEKH